MFFGLKFDAFSIAATNAMYILMCALPFNFYYSKGYQKATSIIFIITNAVAISFNFIDFAYYPFTQKRSTFEVGQMIFGGQTEFTKLIPHFIAGYWHVILLYVVFIWAMIKIHYKIRETEKQETITFNAKNTSISILFFLFLGGTTLLGIRGGVSERPIVLLDANQYTNPKNVPVLINTPFSILKSADLTKLNPIHHYTETELRKIYNPLHMSDSGHFKNTNVCVIILESFSKEFTGIGNRKSYTPFLDSIMSKSIVFSNAIANGKTSINSIPSIIASMPCYLENQYLNSLYCNNNLQTLPNLLKEKDYSSVFFHGGTNGTLNFNSFAQLAGYDKYYGRTEFNDDKEYDGQWGIWDEPFLKKSVTEMSKLKQPFFSSIFTLSSHNPYKIPEKYHGKFPKGNYEITESIGYADYALKQFFIDASKQDWFNNTLFIITADHASVSDDAFFSTTIGQYSIPIALYKNGITAKIEERTVQQIDILPTILDYLNYDKPYYSLGKSMLTENKQPTIFYVSPYYCAVQDSLLYIINDFKITEKYNFKKDSLQKKNLPITNKDSEIINFSKAYIQNYTNDVIENKMTYNLKTKK
ncbi:MAG: LTA synthase family protein [Bacteroidia bacterium]|nr:LTA synthase family protein [Bacteroidia bacterium]